MPVARWHLTRATCNGGNAFFKGNLNKKDIDKLSIDDPFVKEIIDIWPDTFFDGKIVSKDHLLSLPLAKFIN